jgi:glycosyltransferase involved in cell wall biosynthesis
MRIALDARKLTQADSGIGNYTLNLARALLEEDKDLELLLVCHAPLKQTRLCDPRITEVIFPFPAISPFTQFALGPFLRRQQFDVFHTPFDVAPRGLGRPLVVTIHDLNWIVNSRYNSYNPCFRLVSAAYYHFSLAAALREASRILAVSQATRHALIEYVPWHDLKIRVTYNGIDRSRVYPMERDMAYRIIAHLVEPGTPFVLTVGQGTPYKNHFNAVRGFLEAFADRPDYRMLLVRRCVVRDKALEALLHSAQARAQVLAVPYVTPTVLNALYNAARMVLHPSYYEGFGLPLLEAMAVGTPLVTSNLSSMPEVAGPAALLVSPADYQAIAEALVTLDRDHALREKLIAAGHAQLERFSWSNCAKATLAVYRELV